MTLCGTGVLWYGADLRRSGCQKIAKIAEKWAVLESQRAEVERVFFALVGVGHCMAGLTAYHECVRAEHVKVGVRIAEHRPPGSFASPNGASAGKGDKTLTRMECLTNADTAITAARDFFAFTPGRRDAWRTEIGPIIEDLDIFGNIADTLESVNTGP